MGVNAVLSMLSSSVFRMPRFSDHLGHEHPLLYSLCSMIGSLNLWAYSETTPPLDQRQLCVLNPHDEIKREPRLKIDIEKTPNHVSPYIKSMIWSGSLICRWESLVETSRFGKQSVKHDKRKFQDASLHEFASFTNRGLDLIAKYYREKYNIVIFTCSLEESLNRLIEVQDDSSISTYGIICTKDTDPDDYLNHVTPLLVHNTGSKKMILDLDSVGAPCEAFYSALLEIKRSHPEWEIASCSKPRQADQYNCRTDALVILKDALLDIKKNGPALIDELTITSDAHFTKFQLPASWSRTTQMTSALPADLSVPLPTKKAQTLAQFLDRYKQSFDVVDHFEFCNKPYSLDYLNRYTQAKTIRVNTFLNSKSKAYLALINSLLSSGTA